MKSRNSITENSGRRFPGLWEEKVYGSPRQLRNENTSDVNSSCNYKSLHCAFTKEKFVMQIKSLYELW
jgi:hypothetical protein